jgi:cytochrome P450
MGKHACIGNPLARMEAVIATQVLAQQIDALAVISPEQLRYNASFMVRGLLKLPVRVHRRAAA